MHIGIDLIFLLISYLQEKLSSSEEINPKINELQNYINDEEYETDSIYIDFTDNIGIIPSAIQNPSIESGINQFMNENKSMLSYLVYTLCICVFNLPFFFAVIEVQAESFQIGHRFYYWKAYESDEFYVQKKHETFKDEIREYRHLLYTHYQSILLPKVKQYINTKTARRTRVRSLNAGIDELDYGIPPESQITVNHPLCMFIYRLYSIMNRLFTDFSKKLSGQLFSIPFNPFITQTSYT